MATPPFRVKALYNYASQEEDDLSFKGDQIITVTDEEDADWYFGEYEDHSGVKQEGLFPKNFVKNFEPETPPRPVRASRTKKGLESTFPSVQAETNASAGPVNTSFSQGSSAPASNEIVEETQQRPTESHAPVAPELPRQGSTTEASTSVSATSADLKPSHAAAPKSVPPQVTEKPTSNAFRDRINAFNKPTAAPVAPVKPGSLGGAGGSGFIKKPFVAPPPSKNAYIAPPREPPPQRVYRREEVAEVAGPGTGTAEEKMKSPPAVIPFENEEDRPKPTSLKDRIALLQKQQIEQAARHAEASQKKEKARRLKKATEPDEATAEPDDLDGETLENAGSADMSGKGKIDAPQDAAPYSSRPRPYNSQDGSPIGSPVVAPPREIFSDANDADQSGAGDTEEGEETSTGRDDSDEKPRGKPPASMPVGLHRPLQDVNAGDSRTGQADDEEEGEEDDDEEDVDPEVKRRMEIRERMAKMSGGMGMAGMFGPPGGLPTKSTAKKTSGHSERKGSAGSAHARDTTASQAPPVPIMPMPGMQKVRSPEQDLAEIEIDKEGEHEPRSIVQNQDPEDIPDVEDIQEEPVPPSRKSTDRPAPPPISQGWFAVLCSCTKWADFGRSSRTSFTKSKSGSSSSLGRSFCATSTKYLYACTAYFDYKLN